MWAEVKYHGGIDPAAGGHSSACRKHCNRKSAALTTVKTTMFKDIV